MTRTLLALLAVSGIAGLASADDKPKRKAASDQFSKAAGEAFSAAVAADEAGDLSKARGLYEKSWKLKPHPNTAYNLADVDVRAEYVNDAIYWYEMYLTLAPKAADRAAVAQTIASLMDTPGILYIPEKPRDDQDRETLEISTAYIFVDGVMVSKPGAKSQTRTGYRWPGIWVEASGLEEHVLDAVSAVSYGEGIRTHCSPPPGAQAVCSPTMPDVAPGNLVIGGYDDELRVKIEGQKGPLVGHRIELPPGKHTLAISDRSYECKPLVVDVPADDSVRYVHLRLLGDRLLPRCRDLKISQQLLTF